MPIYVRNDPSTRMGVATREGYDFSDMGRILVENAENDMILFRTLLGHDFREHNAIREGYIEDGDELDAYREGSLSDAWEGLKEMLMNVWAKIKSVFNKVIQNLSIWFVRSGKAFVNMNRKAFSEREGQVNDCEIPVYLERKEDPAAPIGTLRTTIVGNLDAYKNGVADDLNDTIEYLFETSGFQGVTLNTFPEAYEKRVLTEHKDVTFGATGHSIQDFCNVLEGKHDAIKALNQAKKTANETINDMIKVLNKKAAASTGDESKEFRNASTICKAFNGIITTGTKAAISCIRKEVGNARQILGKVLQYDISGESTVLEMNAWLEGADDFVFWMDEATGEDLNDPEVRAMMAGIEA